MQVTDDMVMRTGTMYLLSKATVLRGIDIRNLRDAQIMVHNMEAVGPAPCKAIAMTLTQGKTVNSLAHDENVVGFIRSKDRDNCAVGSLASYKVYTEQMSVSKS